MNIIKMAQSNLNFYTSGLLGGKINKNYVTVAVNKRNMLNI